MYIELSPEAKQICADSYTNNCGKCPLRPACINNKTVHSIEDMNREVTTINELAEQLIN